MAENKLVAHLTNGVTLTIVRSSSTGGGGYYFRIYVDGIYNAIKEALDIDSVLKKYLKEHNTAVQNGDFSQKQQPTLLSAPPPDKKKIQNGMEMMAQLDDLRKREAITKAEYETLKAKILAILE